MSHSNSKSTIVIGCFDGVHLGHQYLIRQALQVAHINNQPCYLITFDPDPELFYKEDKCDCLIMQTSQKLLYLQDSFPEIDMLITLPYDQDFARLEPVVFLKKILLEHLHMGNIVVGSNFRFGFKQTGDIDLLYRFSREFDYKVVEVELNTDSNKQIYSSSGIRDKIRSGKIFEATQALGHDWYLEGKVVLGRQQCPKYPTANIDLYTYVWPKIGVYAAWVFLPTVYLTHTPLPAVVNFGYAPTFNDSQSYPHLAVHILKPIAGNLCGCSLQVKLVEFLRPEGCFSSRDSLEKQIALDCKAASQILESQIF